MSESLTAPPQRSGGAEAAPRPLLTGRLWLWVLVVGAGVWLVTALIAGFTDVPNLVPNVLVLGSFLVPVAAVLYAYSRPTGYGMSAGALIVGFLGGGTLGTLFAAVTEVYFLPAAAGTFLSVALFEETAKGLVVAAVAWWLPVRRARDGMVLGATVGAGFAAFESTGYAFQTFMKHSGDHAILDVFSTEAQRAVLAPFGHITWTALLGGAIFAAWRRDAFGPIAPVLWTFVGVVALHAAWDATYGWSIIIAQGVEGSGWFAGWPNTTDWIGTPTGSELWAFNITYGLFIGLNALIGTVWLVRRWRRYGVDEPAST
jgi:RsiW-degrading membrane proteinase PrsW (M82 family)